MAIPTVPSVKKAAWRHPYKFSHRMAWWGLPLMLAGGAVAALAAGVGGYFGGAVTYWLVVQINRLVVPLVIWLADEAGVVGTGVGTALAFLPTLLIGVCYPSLIGAVAGTGVALGAKTGKCRMPALAGFVGLLAGVAALVTLHLTARFMGAPILASSRLLQEAHPGIQTLLLAVDGVIIVWAGAAAVRSQYQTPYCERCGQWFGSPKIFTIQASQAATLIEALESQSARPLQPVPVGTPAQARIQLALARCACGQSPYSLTATLLGAVVEGNKKEAQSSVWFRTTLPPAFGAELQTWATAVAEPAAEHSPTAAAAKQPVRPVTVQAPANAPPLSAGAAKPALVKATAAAPAEVAAATPGAAPPDAGPGLVETEATPTPEPPSAPPIEITWLTISTITQQGDYEELARVLSTLDKRSDAEYATDKEAYRRTCELIKAVGELLDRQGGEALMQQVLNRARALGCNARFVEGEWSGIGTWLG